MTMLRGENDGKLEVKTSKVQIYINQRKMAGNWFHIY